MAPAARIGDQTNHGGALLPPGAPTVLIEGLPAAVLGTNHACAIVPTPATPHPTITPLVNGSATVLAGGQPLARVGDAAACGATIVIGATTVMAS